MIFETVANAVCFFLGLDSASGSDPFFPPKSPKCPNHKKLVKLTKLLSARSTCAIPCAHKITPTRWSKCHEQLRVQTDADFPRCFSVVRLHI